MSLLNPTYSGIPPKNNLYYIKCPDNPKHFRTIHIIYNNYSSSLKGRLSNSVYGEVPDGIEELPKKYLYLIDGENLTTDTSKDYDNIPVAAPPTPTALSLQNVIRKNKIEYVPPPEHRIRPVAESEIPTALKLKDIANHILIHNEETLKKRMSDGAKRLRGKMTPREMRDRKIDDLDQRDNSWTGLR